MKYLLLLIVLIIIYSCAFDNDKDSTSPIEEKTTSWLTVSEWRASTFDANWFLPGDKVFSTKSPVQCSLVVSSAKEKYFAFDIFGLDERTLGVFDSISFSYRSNIDLGICTAVRWHDELGDDIHIFELADGSTQFLPKCEETKRITFKKSDFGGDIGSFDSVEGQEATTIDKCNNFGIWNKNGISVGDTLMVSIANIEIYR